MEMETENNPTKLFERGMALLKRGYPGDAMEYFEKLLSLGHKGSACYSWLGIAMARSKWDMEMAEELCRIAVKRDFYVPQFYVNLAEVYLLKGNKAKAIETLRAGLKVDSDSEVIWRELDKFGARNRPAIPFLSRNNPVNRYLGLLLSKIGARR